MASKIAIIGDVNGKLAAVFEQKLATMQKKQNFAFAIIAGNLFAEPALSTDEDKAQLEQLLDGKIEVPLPTYFTVGTRSFPPAVLEKLRSNDGELCPNLSVLGRKASIKTTEGFKLVTIGGNYVDKSCDHIEQRPEDVDDYTATYDDKDLEEAENFKDCDILITSDWPADVRVGSKNQYEGRSPPGIRGLGQLVTKLKPRYHFSTSARFFEREPFFHIAEDPRPITRFVSVGSYGTVKSSGTGAEKWIAAYNFEPSAPPPPKLPEGTTATPFVRSAKRTLGDDSPRQNGFRFSNGGGNRYDDHGGHSFKSSRGRGGRRNRYQQHQEPQECYFCLGKPGVEQQQHMITSIGENAYTTIAKGPLPTHKTFASLGYPYHMLIIPLIHHPTISAFPDGDREATLHEMQRYRDALHSMISAKSAQGADGEAEFGAVTWEISRSGGVHLHWQFLPVPAAMCNDGRIEAAFDVEAENFHYPKFAKTPAEKAQVREGNFFRAIIWSESGGEKEILLPLDDGSFRFDLQFGRRVLAKLLGLENRAHWRDVVQSVEEEAADAQFYIKAFKEYDFAHVDNAPENVMKVEGGEAEDQEGMDENGEVSMGRISMKTEEIKTEEIKTEEIKTEETKTEDMNTEE